MNKSKNSTSITVRLSAAERQKLEQDSRAAGLSTSDYIQTLLRGVTPTADRKRQELPWQTNKIFVIAYISLQKPPSLDISGLWALLSFLLSCRKPTQISVTLHRFSGKWCSNWCSDCDCFNLIFSAAPVRQTL